MSDKVQLRDQLVHRDIVKFEEALHKLGGVKLNAAQISAGVMLCAAIDAAWIVEPKTERGEFDGKPRYFYDGENIDELPAGLVRHLGDQVSMAYNRAVSYDPN